MEKKNWNEWNDDVLRIGTKSQVYHNTLLNLMSDIVISIMTGVIYGYSLYLIFTNQITIGTLLAFIAILPRLYPIFRTLFTAHIDIERMKVIENNIDEILSLEQLDSGSADILFSTVPTIQFKNVNFHYEDNESAGIKDLPHQYETKVENNGENFSGGEIQRILLARIFMRDSMILLLDEFISALDAITEHQLNEVLLSFKGKKTIIVIAHRLSTVKNADEIIVIEKGNVKEVGSIPELLDKRVCFMKCISIRKFNKLVHQQIFIRPKLIVEKMNQ